MKKFFITIVCVSLFVAVNFAWASGDGQQDKAPVKKECVEKKDCCNAKTGETKACCADKKDNCTAKAGDAKACCAEKKDCCAEMKDNCAAKAGDAKVCCADKKDCAKATACTNKETVDETKSCGKKAN